MLQHAVVQFFVSFASFPVISSNYHKGAVCSRSEQCKKKRPVLPGRRQAVFILGPRVCSPKQTTKRP